jgi:thiol-disulfide isomerase/thioredoxin
MITTLIADASHLSAQFNFRVAGRVYGMEKGTLAFVESLAPPSYVKVPFENGCFIYEDQTADFKFYNIALLEDAEGSHIGICPFILEAGDTEIEITVRKEQGQTYLDLHFVKPGEMNTCLLQYTSMEKDFSQKYNEARDAWFATRAMKQVSEARSDSLNKLLERNSNNVLGLFLMYTHSRDCTADNIQTAFSKIPTLLRKSKYYKLSWSRFIGARANEVGETINDFCLPDQKDIQICLSQIVSKNNYVLLDFWGSWCGQCIKRTREIMPVYEKHKNDGFEIFGISLEVKKENWLQRIAVEGYNWPNVYELENDIEGDVSISNFLNADRTVPFNILLNGQGKIIAKNLNGAELDLILSKK